MPEFEVSHKSTNLVVRDKTANSLKQKTMEQLNKLGTNLVLVQTELRGTRHYKDEKGTRVVLFSDNSFRIEEVGV